MSTIIETDRIILREITMDDYQFLYDLETNEHSLKYESDTVPTKEDVDKKLEKILNYIEDEDRTDYILLVERKEEKLPIGKVLLWQIAEHIDEWEVGWMIDYNHWGQGYASEAAKALLEFGFNQLGANRIVANCNDENLASERVMQKIGMTKEGVFRETRKLYDKMYGSCIYSILKREYDK